MSISAVVQPEPRPRRLFDYRHATPRQRTAILAAFLFYGIIGYLLISRFVLGSVIIQGESMAPTLRAGERLLVHRWCYHFWAPQRGDIVALRLQGERAELVKRVIALPLERVRFENGRVFVNDTVLDEPYLQGMPTDGGPLGTNTYRVAADCYFVLGDNRGDSTDSRDFGAVPRSRIVGLIRQ